MAWNNNFTMQDLFMNPALKNVVPQFGRREPVQQVYSFAEQKRQVKEYLRGLLSAIESGEILKVKGQQPDILERVREAKTTIEQLFNSMPSIAKNLRANTRVYLPFATSEQIRNISTPDGKVAVLRAIIDNVNFNPNFKSLDTITRDMPPMNFYRLQSKWMREVGYRN